MLVAVLLRVALVLLFPKMAMFGDELDYYRGARELASGLEVSVLPFRPPLYLFFLASIFKVFGPNADAVRIVQAGLEGACVAGLYLLARRVGGHRAGLIAAWSFALFPDFIGYSHTLWSESFSLFVMVSALLLLWRLGERPSWPLAIAVGIAWGMMCLIKPYHVYLTPLLLACTVVCARANARAGMARLAAGALATSFLVIAPWSIYLSLEHGRTILISSTGALNLRDGTNYYSPPQYDFPYPQRVPAELVDALGREEGLMEFVLANPGLFAARAGEKMGYLWSPNSFAIRHLYRGKYGPPERFGAVLRITIASVVMAATAAILLLAIPGFFGSRDALGAAFATAYVLPYSLMITVTPALSRYRLPMMIFAVLYAACFLADGRAALERLKRARVWVPSAILWIALAVAWNARVPEVVAALW